MTSLANVILLAEGSKSWMVALMVLERACQYCEARAYGDKTTYRAPKSERSEFTSEFSRFRASLR